MTTLIPTTPAPTTAAPTTPAPDSLPFVACSRRYVSARREVVIRAWLEDDEHGYIEEVLDKNSTVTLIDEYGAERTVKSEFTDPVGPHVLLFRIPAVLLFPGHAYFLRVQIVGYGTAEFAMGTT